jgi:AhpD family alkylhydroperoxidase
VPGTLRPTCLIRPDITLRRAGINSGPPAAYLSCTTKVVMHVIDAAHKLGATKEEVAEALGVAVSVNAGAAIVYSTRTLDAYAASAEA